jgi:hypothetical protein
VIRGFLELRSSLFPLPQFYKGLAAHIIRIEQTGAGWGTAA